MDELDEVPNKAHDSESDRDCPADLKVFYGIMRKVRYVSRKLRNLWMRVLCNV